MRLSELSLLDSSEIAAHREWNDTSAEQDLSRSVVDLFEAQAALTPEAPACLHESGPVSYGELAARANRIARFLMSRGVGAEVRVGLFFERSPDLLAALLGVLKSGGCYVPLDPAYPPDYVRNIIEDSGLELVLTARALGPRLGLEHGEWVALDDPRIAGRESGGLTSRIHPDQLAYLMYTSGSTGAPKGVMVPHRQILNWLHHLWRKARFDDGEVVAQKTSTSFAISVKELLAGLLAGTPQIFIDEPVVRDVPAFVGELLRWNVSRLYSFPSQIDAILAEARDSARPLRALRHLFLSIEPCPVELIETLRAEMPWTTVWYIYGCTEINDITYCDPDGQISATGFVPIGKPIRNTRTYVLDKTLRVAPVGVMGEIHVESAGIARGYRRLPGLTAGRFIANPFGEPGSRLYKTGDMARYGEDGALEFLGRRDQEMKIRGYRVDVRQVEKMIAAHPKVREAAVTGWPAGATTPQLLAHVVVRPEEALDWEDLRRHLSERLPTYMVPALFVALPQLPRLPNGKLDHLSLPEPDLAGGSQEHVEPRSETEKTLAAIWADALRQGDHPAPRIGVNDNFFTLGGHSLLATQVFSRIRTHFGVDLPISALFDDPILAAFAQRVEKALRHEPHADAVAAVSLVRLAGGPEQPDLICLHPVGGQARVYDELAGHLGASARVLGLQAEAPAAQTSLRDLAVFYCDLITSTAPAPWGYRLLGWSSGGLLALAVAEEIARRGGAVVFLGLVDTLPIPGSAKEPGRLPLVAAANIFGTLRRNGFTMAEIDAAPRALHAAGLDVSALTSEQARPAMEHLARFFGVRIEPTAWDYLLLRRSITQSFLALLAGYAPERLPIAPHVYEPAVPLGMPGSDGDGWSRAISGAQRHRAPGNHYTIMQGENAQRLAEIIAAGLAAADRHMRNKGGER